MMPYSFVYSSKSIRLTDWTFKKKEMKKTNAHVIWPGKFEKSRGQQATHRGSQLT